MENSVSFIVTGTTKLVNPGQPRAAGIFQCVTARAEFPTEEDAKTFVASFPKYLRLKAGAVCGTGRGVVVLFVELTQNGSNKGTNEAGINRLRKLLKRVSYTLEQSHFVNHATVEELAALIG